jgi:hypothetical protein
MPYKDKEKNAACKRAWRISHKDDPILKEKASLHQKLKYSENPEKYKTLSREYRKINYERENEKSRLRMREYAKVRTEEQRQRDLARSRAWRASHPEEHNAETLKRYYANPIPFIVRGMVTRMIRITGSKKTDRAQKYIGCTPQFLRGWLQAQFRDGMTWGNYGKVWVVDHVKPLAVWGLKDHPELVFEASHYTNLQPLFVEENLRKGFKVV